MLCEFLYINISDILNKPLSYKKIKKIIDNLSKEINIVLNKREVEELKLFIKPFK